MADPPAMSLARRVREIEPFLAVEVAERAQELERRGVDVVHLGYGEPDFAPPLVVQQALDRAIRDGHMRYTHSLGILPLREAVADHYRATYGVKVSPEQILITPGTSPAMLLLFGALLDPGDEVVLSDPYYACYPNFIRYAEGVPVTVDTTEEDGFQYRPEAIGPRLGARTKAILVNSPSNPTGAVLVPDRLAAIAALAERNGTFVVADEIYHGLTEGGRDRSILEFTDRAFVLNGFSKAFAMTGWRLGYVIAPPSHVRALQRLYGNFFISTNEFVQWAGVAALREAADEPARFARIFAERRRIMIDGLRAIGLGVGFEPTGAFYILANARHFSSDSLRFAYEILEQSHVAVTPGVAFGRNAEGYLRFSYSASVPRIQEGLQRLGAFLASRR
jgi:aspartate/methionine/tyrosine aminotransferase